MAPAHLAPDLSLSNSAPRPSFGQTLLPSLSIAQQPLFTQRLIPRDFLGTRKSSRGSASKSKDSTSGLLFSGNPFQNDRNTHSRSNEDAQGRLGSDSVGPTETLTAGTPWGRDDDLTIHNKVPTKAAQSFLEHTKVKAKSVSSAALATIESEAQTKIMPRTSSIDSAISNVSTTSLGKLNGEVNEPTPTTVRNLIATAGGAESLVVHLLKEKNNLAAQNAQLWKLLEKQRALIFGLNKDLERLTKERDKYKKRAKDLDIHMVRDDVTSREQITPSPDKGLPSAPALAGKIHQSPLSKTAYENIEDKLSTVGDISGTGTPAHLQYDAMDKENMVADQATNPIPPGVHGVESGTPGLSRAKPKPKPLELGSPGQGIAAPSPSFGLSGKGMLSSRKAPPTPLNLGQGKGAGLANEQQPVQPEAEDNLERGRRRTREEDDQDREVSAKKAEAEARSRSKKSKTPKPLAVGESQLPLQTQIPAPLPTPGLPLSPRPQHAPPPFFGASVPLPVGDSSENTSLTERLLALPLKSPGLPLSPRPFLRNDNPPPTASLPLSPRQNMGAFPLSPRAPKHALPAPTNLAVPTDATTLQVTQSRSHQPSPQTATVTPISPADRLQVHSPVSPEPPEVYRGLANSAYPNLLLPPNALPSIQVRVHSSRLRPSRYGVLNTKHQDDTTVFSLSVISRSSNSELWRVEKIPNSLPQLDQILRPICAALPNLPDRKLFAGQSPALLDERRLVVDNYFEELLDTHISEQAAIAICRFLSTDVVDPDQQTRSASSAGSEMGVPSTFTGGQLPDGPIIKTGYLTKKGKNFGGWKSRFFILDGAEFRYYESAGGPHLGTIRLQNALIGKQKESEAGDEVDPHYRHAFLVQEPKRKDSGSHIRHVLCAESDMERDEWVKALLYWVEGGPPSRGASRNGSIASAHPDTNDVDYRFQSSKAGPSSKDTRDTHINTPTPTSGSSVDSSILDYPGSAMSRNITSPTNGGVVADSSFWGSKSSLPTSSNVKDRAYKMGNIFGFKRPEHAAVQQEPKPAKPRILRHNGYVRPVFGIPLVEAVEFCAPFNVEVDLPAVVYRCIEYLRYKDAAMEEGLFRLSGSNVVVRNLKERFNTEGDVDLVHEDEYHDIHAVASLFKTYLRELPSTLLTRDLHIEFIKVLELQSHADKVAAYNTLVNMLPPTNLSLLREMSKYLLEVTQSSDKNKMSVRNIGIVFSPTLNIPTPVFTMFLTEYDGIFEQQSGQNLEIRTTEIQTSSALTADDIRSPRHQMFSDLPTPAPSQTTFHNQMTMRPPQGTMTGTGAQGFVPIHPTHDTSNFAHAQVGHQLTQVPELGAFSSLNGLLAPTNAPNDRARKRHSVIIT